MGIYPTKRKAWCYMNQNLIYAFEIMGKGMLSIFVVIILLMAIVTFIPWVTNFFGNKKNGNNN